MVVYMIFLCRKLMAGLLGASILLTGMKGALNNHWRMEKVVQVVRKSGPEQTQVDGSSTLPASSLYSRSCALSDGYTGRILYGKEENAPRANASTTKIMTCILALELGKMEDVVTVSERAARQPRVHLGMRTGETYRMKDLLYCLMLESYNDCAVAVAEQIAGSVEAFAEIMNRKAEEIGCEDTHFITPNGLDEEDGESFHHSTAADLCRIMRYCAWESPKSGEFLEITGTKSYSFTDDKGEKHSLNNYNRLLSTMEGALTGKTGFTADAGYCYVMAYEKEGKRFCAALLGCSWPNRKNDKWKDAGKLIQFAEEQFRRENLFKVPELAPCRIADSHPKNPVLADWGGDVELMPVLEEKEEEIWCMVSDRDEVGREVSFRELEAPVRKGDVIGSYELRVGDLVLKRYPVTAGGDAQEWDFYSLIKVICKTFFYVKDSV